jgi:hypothetical protein
MKDCISDGSRHSMRFGRATLCEDISIVYFYFYFFVSEVSEVL